MERENEAESEKLESADEKTETAVDAIVRKEDSAETESKINAKEADDHPRELPEDDDVQTKEKKEDTVMTNWWDWLCELFKCKEEIESDPSVTNAGIYHEYQSLQRCAIHTVNNILQRKVFTKADFDRIANELSPTAFINPHKSIWGTGNYDVNVIMVAFKEQGYKIRWFDKRKSVDEIDFDKCCGMVLNKRKDWFFGLRTTKHWIAMTKISKHFCVIDSQNEEPCPFETLEETKEYLKKFLWDKNGKENDNQALLVFMDEQKEESHE